MLTAQRAPRTLDPADGDLLAAARRDASAAEQAGRLTPRSPRRSPGPASRDTSSPANRAVQRASSAPW